MANKKSVNGQNCFLKNLMMISSVTFCAHFKHVKLDVTVECQNQEIFITVKVELEKFADQFPQKLVEQIN